jgi:hypothetical protein
MAKKLDTRTGTNNEDLVVFWTVTNSVCDECAVEMEVGSFLIKEAERALCLNCADLGHLEFLPRGDTALTRRSRKYSALSAVVVKFSRARKRCERQGVLVEREALERAGQDCLEDADARAAATQRAARRRNQEDGEYIARFSDEIRRHFPKCPNEEAKAIAQHACRKHSGRVGRSAAAKALDTEAIELAVRAHVRHVHTQYDSLLAKGRERAAARSEVAADVAKTMDSWT